MKLHFGSPPENPDFDPEKGGWTPLWELTPRMIQVLGIPGSVFLGFLAVVAFRRLSPIGESVPPVWALPGIFFLVLPLHELIHALFHPGNGLSDKTIIGIWPGRLAFYARYQGIMGMARRMTTIIMPFLLLTVLPIGAMGILGKGNIFIALAATFNAMVSCGDVIAFFTILIQVPTGACLQDKGWRTYQRAGEKGT